MGTKNNPGTYDCYEKADPDEPMFVLLARDPQAPALVTIWALDRQTVAGRDDEKAQEAMACVRAMNEWRETHQ